LLAQPTIELKSELIKVKVNENLYLFLSLMEQYQGQGQEFLSIIINLYKDFKEDVSIQLLVRACAIYKGEKLTINSKMVQKAMGFLIENKNFNHSAFGLLCLAFQNSISFAAFDIKLLSDFE
jgi:hypothetical protein